MTHKGIGGGSVSYFGSFYREDMVGTSSLIFKSMDANLIFNRGSFLSIASGLPLGDDLSKTGM